MVDVIPAVSVVVPAYNAQRYLERCVRSILEQTLSPLELILVDDGSTDDTSAISDALAQQDGRLRVIHKPNGGPSDARNVGIEALRSTWLLFVDSDDYLSSDALQLLVSAQERTGADMVVAGFVSVDPAEQVLEYNSPGDHLFDERGFWQARYNTGDIQVPGNGVCFISSCDTLFRNGLFATERFDRGRTSEDEFIIHRLVAQSATIATVSDCCYFCTLREDGISGTRDAEGMLDGAEALLVRASYLVSKGMHKEALVSIKQALSVIAHSRHHRQSAGSASRSARLTKEADAILRNVNLGGHKMAFRLKLALFRFSPALYDMASRLRNNGLRKSK